MRRVTVTGASGLIGSKLVAALQERGDDVTALSRRPGEAQRKLGVEAIGWNPEAEPAPVAALAGRDAVIHLAGEPIAQRWTDKSKERIRVSREVGTTLLVDGLRQCEQRPPALVSASAIGYYGAHGDERLDESAPSGSGFLAGVCRAWERSARAAADLGMRVVNVRTGVLLDPADGALARMLPPFRLGLGGPVAGGDQYISWIAPDDLVRLYLAALDEPRWSGPVNATAPEPVTNREFSHALGRALRRPAILPIPGFALGLLYGEMASVITTGQRVVPAHALERGFEFQHATVDGALAAAVRSR
ncbi:MAG: TIGR01777 family oxidoreductase [Gaiellaceae bacterium]